MLGGQTYFIFYILYFSKSQGALGAIVKHDKKNIKGHWKGPFFLLLGQQGSPKRTFDNRGGAM